MANVLKPKHFAVRGIEKRRTIPAETGGRAVESLRVALRLREHVLRPKGHLFRLDHAQKLAVYDEGIICGPVRGWIFLYGVMGVGAERFSVIERNDLPTARPESRINPASPRAPFVFRKRVTGGHRR